ncbi:MAG: leucyl/phenylalanyl-tRNA--protein transferase, partial [Chitinophagales bacterium]
SLESNTSKLALIFLARESDLSLIDCQVYTAHLERMGAMSIKLERFLTILNKECS